MNYPIINVRQLKSFRYFLFDVKSKFYSQHEAYHDVCKCSDDYLHPYYFLLPPPFFSLVFFFRSLPLPPPPSSLFPTSSYLLLFMQFKITDTVVVTLKDVFMLKENSYINSWVVEEQE